MTTELEYKCPSCGHLLGQTEYHQACEKLQGKLTEQLQQQKLQFEKELREKDEEFDRKVDSLVTFRLSNERKVLEDQKNQLREESEAFKSQALNLANETIKEALSKKEEEIRQKDNEHSLQIKRYKEDNKKLQLQIEEQAKKIHDISSERRGTAGENGLLDELKQEFKTDEFTCKKNGVAMADIIQTIVTEKGERIGTPIIYDKKTSSKVTKLDLDKAKNYKRIHNTEHCMIVTTDITETIPPRYTEMKDGIFLVHPMVVVDVTKFIRNSIIETSRLDKVKGCGNIAKDRIYEFLTSLEYNRDKQAKIEAKLKLDELHRSELKIWSKREECIRKWFEIDCKFDAFVSSVTKGEDGENPST